MNSADFNQSLTIVHKSPPFVPESFAALKPSVGSRTYVTTSTTSGLIIPTVKGFLPSELDEIDDSHDGNERTIVLGEEQDIAQNVKSPIPINLIGVGIGFPDGACVAAMHFRDAIVEYRSNIGVESKRANVIPGKSNIYMGSYASIGIPLKRYEWIIECIKDVHSLEMATSSKGVPQIYQGYAWFIANIPSGDSPVAVVVGQGKSERMSLISLLSALKVSVRGIVCTTATLKRVEEEGRLKRVLGFTLKGIQVVDQTTVSSPPLKTAVEFVEDPASNASAGIWDFVQKSRAAATSEGHTPIHRSVKPTI